MKSVAAFLQGWLGKLAQQGTTLSYASRRACIAKVVFQLNNYKRNLKRENQKLASFGRVCH